jgi:[ribosomal protein S5]-alanine N-acetyltransferase
MDLPTIKAPRLQLREFAPEDGARVQELAGSREVASTTLNIPHPYQDGLAEAWILSHPAAWNASERLTLAIATQADGLIGAISIHLVPEHRRGELGYWIGIPYWGQGYATEAATAILRFGFGSLNLHRIVARHLSRNPASGRVLQKIGMVREGIQREHVIKWGQAEDLEYYAILEHEWRGG